MASVLRSAEVAFISLYIKNDLFYLNCAPGALGVFFFFVSWQQISFVVEKREVSFLPTGDLELFLPTLVLQHAACAHTTDVLVSPPVGVYSSYIIALFVCKKTFLDLECCFECAKIFKFQLESLSSSLGVIKNVEGTHLC